MQSFKLEPSACPICKTVLDAAATMIGDGSPPTQGDWTVCAECGGILTFDADLKLTIAAPEDEPPEPCDVLSKKVQELRRKTARR